MATTSQTNTAKQRLAALRSEMKANKLDAYVIAHVPSLRYLFGFSGSTALAIVTGRKAYFFTNDLYEVQVRKELIKLDGLEVIIDRDSWGTLAKKGLAKTWKSVGFDPTKHSVASYKVMKKALGSAKLIEVVGIVENITRVKSAAEIKSISQAAQIASTAYERMLKNDVKYRFVIDLASLK